MNKEDYVSLEVAKLLEGKGFNEPCDAIYMVSEDGRTTFQRYLTDDVRKSIGVGKIKDGYLYDSYIAPSLYDMQTWLRKKHNIYITTISFIPTLFEFEGDDVPKHLGFNPIVTYKNKNGKWVAEFCYTDMYDSLQEAMNVCIKKALKLI